MSASSYSIKMSPFGIYRTLTNYPGPGYWQYFRVNSDGSYYRDANGDYVYEPVWIKLESYQPQQNGKRKNNKRKGNTN